MKAAVPRSHYLNVCRQTRNKTDYDRAGVTEEEEVEELLAEVSRFRQDEALQATCMRYEKTAVAYGALSASLQV